MESGSMIIEGSIKQDQNMITDYCLQPTTYMMDEELESARTEMGEVREENERLKMKLKQIEKDYQSLKMQFFDVFQQDSCNKVSKNSSSPTSNILEERDQDQNQLVSLSLGRSPKKEETNSTRRGSSKPKEDHHHHHHQDQEVLKEDLFLGLDLNHNRNSENSFEELKEDHQQEEEEEEEAREEPNKVLKTMRNGDDDVVLQQNHVKRARVSVRARCDAPTMNDGCQWRKYGQKISKGNPCPRAYYRCTVAPACPVRKQVQRCAEDMSILITTYEGTHNHPLPISATAMASTTSAAASMLMSGSSSTSTQGLNDHLHGLNFNNLFDSSRHRQYYIPNNSSSSPAFPTITLDLTTTYPSSSSPSISSTLFNRLSSNYLPSITTKLPSTSLNFSSSQYSNILPTLWGNDQLSHGTIPSGRTLSAPFDFGRESQDHVYQTYMGKNGQPPSQPQQFLTETLTKAITSDPSFRSVIAAAISSMSAGSGGDAKNQSGGVTFGQNLKWGEPIPAATSSNALSHNAKGCASSYLDRTSDSQRGSSMSLQPPFPFSISKGNAAAPAAASVADHRNELN